jgi:hypothetical protein
MAQSEDPQHSLVLLKAYPERPTIIVGGGVIGICCAYFLAKLGARVIVLERDQIGRGASYGNARCIAPYHPPINSRAAYGKRLSRCSNPLSPLYVAPRLDPALAKWLWKFSRNCTERDVERAMRILAPLGRVSRRLFDELINTEGLECGFRGEGYYEICLTDRGLESARNEAALVSRFGFHPEMLPGGAVREREPAINGSVVGGIFYPEAATVNPYHFVLEMAKRAEGYGAELWVQRPSPCTPSIAGFAVFGRRPVNSSKLALLFWQAGPTARRLCLRSALVSRYRQPRATTAIANPGRVSHRSSAMLVCSERIWCSAHPWTDLCGLPGRSNSRG